MISYHGIVQINRKVICVKCANVIYMHSKVEYNDTCKRQTKNKHNRLVYIFVIFGLNPEVLSGCK